MAGDEPQRQMFHMIRELTSERTIEERRISDLSKRVLECQTNYETVSAEFEKAKLERQAAERKLRGSLVQLNRTCASLSMMETRRSRLQDEISQVSSELHAIKNASEIEGDNFVRAMHGFNREIRKFNEMSSQALKNRQPDISTDSDQMMDMQNKKTQNNLENEILLVDAQMQRLEGDYRRTADDADKVLEELAYLKKKVSLSEEIMLQSERLKDLSTNNQISELEKACSSLGEELQRRYKCPKCQLSNMEEASEPISQAEGSPSASTSTTGKQVN